MLSIEAHASDSLAQRDAEVIALKELNSLSGHQLVSQALILSNGAKIQVDGYNEETRIACEIYCRVGSLKPAQKDKIASDILKFLLIERLSNENWTKILCFVDEKAAASVKNSSWLASTCAAFDIEVKVVSIPDDLKISLLAAQERQKNPQKRVKPTV